MREKVAKGSGRILMSTLLFAPSVVSLEIEKAALMNIDHLFAHLALLGTWQRHGDSQDATHAGKGPLDGGCEIVWIGISKLV